MSREHVAQALLLTLLVHACTGEPAPEASPSAVTADSPGGSVPLVPESSSPPVDPSGSTPGPVETSPQSSGGGGGGMATGGAPAPPAPAPEDTANARGGAGTSPTDAPVPRGGSSGAGGSAGSMQGESAGSTAGGADAGGTAGVSATAGADAGAMDPSRPARVLLYSFSTLDIPSVPAQLAILRQTLEGWQYEVEESVDPGAFSEDNLARFAAVGMINTCFSPFGQDQSGETESLVLQSFLQQGGGLFGTHCADVTFQSANPPALYNQLIGGRASSQNFEGDSQCRKLEEHPTTQGLLDEFTYTGNLDGTDFIAEDSTVLVSCAWNAGAGMEVAVSWVRNEGAGRVFFTNFGKVDADLTNATIGDPHILAGLGWVLGR